MKTKCLCVVALIMAITSCTGSPKKNNVQAESKDTVKEQVKAADFYGTYEGILPCADCEGIKTTLTINKDKTYSLKSDYIGEKDGVFESSGVYEMIDKTLIELITPSSGEKTYYKILENGMMLSDEAGTINQGALAEHYILKKK